jgi:hypothetical protein
LDAGFGLQLAGHAPIRRTRDGARRAAPGDDHLCVRFACARDGSTDGADRRFHSSLVPAFPAGIERPEETGLSSDHENPTGSRPSAGSDQAYPRHLKDFLRAKWSHP